MGKQKTLLVRPKSAFTNVGGTFGVRLNPKRIYRAVIATNQPNYKKRGLIFIDVKQKAGTDEFLLDKEDYIIVKKKLRKVI
jgi:hypothetical protein